MKREFKDYFIDLMDSINKIEEFTEGMEYNDFLKDNKTIFACVRAIEIMGEAVKNIPEYVKEENKEIPWKKIYGIRNKLIHEYFGVEPEVVWITIKEDIPLIKPYIMEILEELD